jgi:hypothetical protein
MGVKSFINKIRMYFRNLRRRITRKIFFWMFGWEDWVTDFFLEAKRAFFYGVGTPFRWLEDRLNRLLVRILAFFLRRWFNIKVQSPLLEPDPNLYWYQRWDIPEGDFFAFPTMAEWSFVFATVAAFKFVELVWNWYFPVHWGIPFYFHDFIDCLMALYLGVLFHICLWIWQNGGGRGPWW